MGANVQPGQDVVVIGLVEHAEIARAIASAAYRAGAKHVVVLYGDLHLRRAAIELGPAEELGWSPPYLLDWYRRWSEERPALVSLTGNPEPDLLSDLDLVLVGRAEPRDLRATLVEHISAARFNWTIVAAPSAGWATAVFGEPDVERLWDAVARATRLTNRTRSPPGATTPRRSKLARTRSTTVGSTRSASRARGPTSRWG